MPIEIRELIIRARIDDSTTANPQAATPSPQFLSSTDREAIIAACVEQVMQILEDKKER